MNNCRATVDPLLMLGFNELNFDFVRRYAEKGVLPNFEKLISQFGVTETTSESRYENIEPWIQWVTIHTGLDYAEHNVFRLGDAAENCPVQIWELLERECGISVAAISPMNAVNRTISSPFFMPDPWTETRVSGVRALAALYRGARQAISDNAQGAVTMRSAALLAYAFLYYGRGKNLGDYFRWLAESRKHAWKRVLFLDRLLADAFMVSWRRHRPKFSSIFLNGAAHLQHHYLFDSAVYDGGCDNPAWYSSGVADPVEEIYRLYDTALGEVLGLDSRLRVMVVTGLHQDPHENVTFYYRLKDHRAFLSRLQVDFANVSPRMSRDFVVEFKSFDQACDAEKALASVRARDGLRIFEVDNRGKSLFVTLTYPREIDRDLEVVWRKGEINGFDQEVSFVAIKNGQHNGTGYFVDTKGQRAHKKRIPLKDIHSVILEHFGLNAADENWFSAPRSPALARHCSGRERRVGTGMSETHGPE